MEEKKEPQEPELNQEQLLPVEGRAELGDRNETGESPGNKEEGLIGETPQSPEVVTSPSLPSQPNKKAIFLLIGFGFLLFLLLGLGIRTLLKGRKSNEKSITLTYWGLWEPEPVMEGIIAEWQEKHPNIKVKYIKQDKEDYRVRLQSVFSRGDGPDIFRLHQTWVPMLKGDLAPVPNSVVTALGLEKDYFPIVKESLQQGGQFYGVPLMVDTLALYYNKDILSAANKSPPRTWWGLRKLAKELTVKDEVGKVRTAGVALGTTSNVDHWSDILGLMIYQNGGNPAQPNNQLVEDVLSFYTIFKLEDKVWDETLPNSTLAFASGKLAFYFAPSWRVFNLLEANPSLNFAVTVVPQLPKLRETDRELAEKGEAELTNIGWASFWVEGVWVKSKYQKEAWQFLQFLASKEGLQKLYTAESQVRLFGEIYPRVDLAQNLKTDPLLIPFIEQAKVAKTWYLCSFTHDAGINDRIIKYYEDAINAINQGEQATKVLETLDQGVKQVLTQYQITP